MNGSDLTYVFLAQISRWRRLGDGLHRGHGRMDFMSILPWAIFLAAAAIVVAVIFAIRKRNDMSTPCDDPDKLFREISLSHGLDRASQQLLWRLANALQLPQPAEVFVTPALFQAEKLPQALRGEAAELNALRERLF